MAGSKPKIAYAPAKKAGIASGELRQIMAAPKAAAAATKWEAARTDTEPAALNAT